MSTTLYQSWPGLLSQIQQEMNKAFDQKLSMNELDNSHIATSQWAPAVDIKEEKDCFVILADIPGVNPKEIQVSMENGVLSIQGERNMTKDSKSNVYARLERAHGIFYRRFSLPDTADSQHITAKGKHGVLEITIPKIQKSKSMKIDIYVEA